MGTDHTRAGAPDHPGPLPGDPAWTGTEGEPPLDHHVEEILLALSELSHHGADAQPGGAALPPSAG